jgi:hypothetical protein
MDSWPTRRFKSTFSFSSLIEEGFAPILKLFYVQIRRFNGKILFRKEIILINLERPLFWRRQHFYFYTNNRWHTFPCSDFSRRLHLQMNTGRKNTLDLTMCYVLTFWGLSIRTSAVRVSRVNLNKGK